LIASFRLPVFLALGLTACLTSAQQALTSPEEHLGRPVGGDFELADWNEVSSYFEGLGQASSRVIVETVGQTTEGRDFLLATISSEANLARLDEIKALAAQIADPRGLDATERKALLDQAVPILFVSIGMHSTETAAPQFSMEFAHQLATSNEEPFVSARENMVILIAPCLNPDGLDEVVSWYRETVGTPYEASSLLRLYQWYAGHDNNRDWFMLTQAETRIVTELLYSTWHPQVYWDVHQQGQSRERFFVPPFRDPLNPNLDPSIIAGIDALGSRALFDMTSAGFSGISTGVTYDMWWNGGNRNVPVRHNVIGLLTEAASVNIASPVFLPLDKLSPPRGLDGYAPSNRFPDPWPGGWWRLRDIIDYEHAFGKSLIGSLSREPRKWLENALHAAERALTKADEGGPRAWILPSENQDRGAGRRLFESLLLGGVELHVSDEELQADGRTWPAGSVVIQRNQPYGKHVKDLFEVQRYPEGDPPYDVSGWTLPLLLGVRRVEVMQAIDVDLREVEAAADAVASWRQSTDDDLHTSNSDDWVRFLAHLKSGKSGSLGFIDDSIEVDEVVEGRLKLAGSEESANWKTVDGMPRIGLYAPWSGVKNEGWLRWVFDEFELPFVRVRNEMIRAGELSEFLDVLVLPSISARYLDAGRSSGSVPEEYARGLDPEGAVAVEEFVRTGGKLIALDDSAAWATELFDLPLVDVTREENEFSCPGSVLRTTPADFPLTAGLGESLPIFFSNSSAWRLRDSDDEQAPHRSGEDERQIDMLLKIAPTRVLYSGWVREPEVIADRGVWVRARHGSGEVHLFGFRPQYRGWSQAAFQLLFRALLFTDD
jgi:hypothetical protein